MGISEWSDAIVLADLEDEPALSDDLRAMARRLEQKKSGCGHVVLNMSAVNYLNSSNLAQLLRLRKLCMEHRRRLCLCSVSTQVWGILLVTGLDKVFDFKDDVMVALASVQLEQ